MKPKAYRVLVVDDNVAIHDDFHKVLTQSPADTRIDAAERALFDLHAIPEPLDRGFALAFASQGEEALGLVRDAVAADDRFAVAFVDVRMPPGIDGVETARRLWGLDPELQVVICSAYSDFSWTQMAQELGAPDRWVILKKPFDTAEVLQLAHALTEKWTLRQLARAKVADLERTVAVRTADLQAALEQLKREIGERERAEVERREIERKLEDTQRLESLGVLAGGVAHDFNNILTGILVSATMARMEAPRGTELERQLEVIEKNARRAASLCEQMLTYAGRGRVDPRPLELGAVVRDALAIIQSSVPRDAKVELRLAPELPKIIGDDSRLKQVVTNLLLNAFEALTGTRREVTLATGAVALDVTALGRMAHAAGAAAGTYAYFEVADTGAGMSAETVRRMFEPFFTTKFAGRGLGLSAVLGIVRSHAGALDVHSDVGGGTKIRVYLPTVRAR